ncbi:MAG: hypothetical protein QM776_08335 [Rhodocyclaceae bacterium]
MRFNVEARQRYLDFAASSQALWRGNFRELSASLTRMATLAESGRITEALVVEEIARLRNSWSGGVARDLVQEVLGDAADALDLFDRCQLDAVIAACRAATSLSEAGRKLFAMSRQEKKVANDADRLRKYLARFELDWADVRRAGGAS